jgi:hypothetical protein
VLRCLDASGGGSFAPIRAEAERLVHAHWDAIERVAAALSERGELSGAEVDALIASPSRPPPSEQRDARASSSDHFVGADEQGRRYVERDSRNGTLWNVRLELADQSGLMLGARTTVPHFSVSLTISLSKSPGEPGSAVTPNSARRAFILGSARAAVPTV